MKRVVIHRLTVLSACFYDAMLQQGMWLAEVHVYEMLLISFVTYSAQSAKHALDNDKL